MVALTVTAIIGAFLLLAPLPLLVLPPTELPAPFPDQHQDAETLLFLLAFAVILPLAVRFVPRIADRIAAGPNGDALPAATAATAAGLLTMLLAVKISDSLPWGGGVWVLFVAMLIWSIAAAATLSGLAAPRRARFADRLGGRAEAIWWLDLGLVFAVALSFAFLQSITLLPLVAAAAVAAAGVVAYRRLDPPGLHGGWGIGVDLVVAGLVFLAVPNLVILRPEIGSAAFETSILQFHQDFFLGPASHVVGGGAMLVDTLSQYGVASIDFIAGWFALVGVSHGMLGLLDGLLHGFVFVGAYVVLRSAGVSRILAASAMVVAVIVLVDGLVYPIGGLLQHGAIRFGLPMLILVGAVAELRATRISGVARVALPVAVGLSSIWALEAFAYTSFTFLGVLGVRAWLLPGGTRRRWLLRRLGEAALACVGAHAAFALFTVVVSGELPDWGLYLGTLREFLGGSVGDLTYDFSPWSPGFAVAAIYLASAAGIALLLKRADAFARRESRAVVALAGSTAYGIALFSYLVNRSADHIIPYISLPALMVVVLWLSVLFRSEGVAQRARSAALGAALGVSALLVAVAWSGAGDHFSQSALAHVLPGGKSLSAAVSRLRDMPPLSAGAVEAEDLLDQYWPGQNESLVIVEPGLGIEALARTGRINVLPLSDPYEDSLVPDQRLGHLDEALAGLSAGDLVLLDAGALRSFRAFERDPDRDPFAIETDPSLVPSGLALLQEYSLASISERFRLRTLARRSGLEVAELIPR